MRILKTEIWIDKNNQWWVSENQMINEGVLKFFKMNLHFDNDYFIHLSTTNNEEKGYLKSIEGFPLICIDVEFYSKLPILKIDNNKTMELTNIYYDLQRNSFWGILPDIEYNSYLPFMFSSKSLQLLQRYFTEEQDKPSLFYNNYEIPIIYKNYEPYKFKDRD